MLAAALALAVAAGAAPAGPGVRISLPPAPVRLYAVAWQRPFVPLRPLEWKPAERGGVAVDPATGMAVLGTRDGWLHAVRPDGTVAWEFRANGPLGPPVVDGDTVYAGSTDGRLYAVAVANGKERWHYDAREDLTTRPAVHDGGVYVASLQDTLFCVDAATGAWRWHHRRERKGEGFSIFGAASVAAGGDAVYAAYSDGFAAALDPKSGAARWERRVAPAGTPADVDALVLDGSRLFAAAYPGAILAIDARTGETVWTHEAPGATQVSVAGGLVVGVTSGNIVALSPVDGGVVWTAPLGGAPVAPPVAAGKWLLVPAGGGGLRWLELASGRTLRVFDPGTGVSGPPATSGTRVYVLSNGGDLFALDAR